MVLILEIVHAYILYITFLVYFMTYRSPGHLILIGLTVRIYPRIEILNTGCQLSFHATLHSTLWEYT